MTYSSGWTQLRSWVESLNGTGNIRFSRREKRVCAAITLDEADFHTEYNRGTNAWTVSWKWSGDQPPISLWNRLSEYPSPMWLREQYEEELQAWIDSGWLCPYPEDELGPPRGLIPQWPTYKRTRKRSDPPWTTVNLNTSTRTWQELTFAHTNWGSGGSRDQTWQFWTCAEPTSKYVWKIAMAIPDCRN